MRKPYQILLLSVTLSAAPLAGMAQFNNAPAYAFSNNFIGAPFASQYPMAPNWASPLAQPTPFWMQTPSAAPSTSNYVNALPENSSVQSVYPDQTGSGPRVSPFQTASPSGPPRWAPISGEIPPRVSNPRMGNQWSLDPITEHGPEIVLPTVNTPPKWPTP